MRDPSFRIAAGGFQHETNVFSSVKASYEDFLLHDGWPGLTRGPEMFDTMRPINLPISGFIVEAEASMSEDHDLVMEPLLWCSAEPCAHVESEAFDKICGMLCKDLQALVESQEGLDGVYLDLHGAMVTETFDDGEAELLRRIRAIVGPRMPLVISLDWHANLSSEAFALADAVTIYRTYPHIDMDETGARCFRLLKQMIKTNSRPHKAWRRVPYLIPLTAQCSDMEPARSLCAEVVASSQAVDMLSADFAPGFPLSDGYSCHPTIVCFGSEPAAVEAEADRLLSLVLSAESKWENDLKSPEDAIEEAMTLTESSGLRQSSEGRESSEEEDAPEAWEGTAVVADVQDNTGAGATADTVAVLECMIRQEAQGVVGLLCDAAAVGQAARVGEGGVVKIALGGKGVGHDLDVTVEVERVTDGQFECTGDMMRGTKADLGGTALLRVAGTGVRVAVSSRKFQCLDRAVFTHLGVQPARERVVVVKSSVHFRADFAPLAKGVVLAEAPGESLMRNEQIPFRKLAPATRVSPLGPVFADVRADADELLPLKGAGGGRGLAGVEAMGAEVN